MSHNPQALESHLPPQLRRLVPAIGLPATVKLLQKLGGTRLRLPQRAENCRALVEVIGLDAARAVVAEFRQGDTFAEVVDLYLPMPDKLLSHSRDQDIRLRHAQGESLRSLALRYSLTARHIVNIVGSTDQPSEQADLFGEARGAV